MPEQLTEAQRENIRKNIGTLKYLSGIGMTRKKKQNLSNDNFIFVGLGGSGISILCDLKEEIHQMIRPEEIADKVKFIAIDTDSRNNLEHKINNGILSRDEALVLASNPNVHDSINPVRENWKYVKGWANSGLYNVTSDANEYNGIGAGARRQVGRTHLMFNNNYDELRQRLISATNTLTTGKANADVKVFVFAGIAGGTGSGTLIDFGIILRNVLNADNPNIHVNRVNYRAFVLMPSAYGGAVSTGERITGERNAYAVIKELDYLNTMHDQGSRYSEKYGYGDVLSINDKVYDFVSLIEGESNEARLPEGTAKSVLVKTIASMIIANDFTTLQAGNQVFLLDSLLSNTIKVDTAVQAGQKEHYPRNANYAYNSLGYTECVLPVDLIVSYVMKKVFEEFYTMYKQAGDFSNMRLDQKAAIVQKFLVDCHLTESEIREGISEKNLHDNVDATIREMIALEGKGPFYVIDFTYFLASKDHHYLDNIINDYNSGHLLLGTRGRQNCQNVYRKLKSYISELNNSVFNIYTTVIEELKNIIYNDADILTSTAIFHNTFSTTFSWTPVAFDGNTVGHTALEQFVGQTYISQTHDFAIQLSTDMWDHKDDWADIETIDRADSSECGAAKAIREFVSARISEKVNGDKEKLLTIAYSGNPNATLRDSEGNPSSDVITAAKEIYKEIKKNVLPLASYVNDMYDQVAPLKYIAVPEDWEDIGKAIEKEVENEVSDFKFSVYHTSINDRISAFQVNHGIAPFMLRSVANTLQKSYETEPTSIGLHLVQGEKGNWIELQNLSPMDTWDIKLTKDGWRENDKITMIDFDNHPEISKRECIIIEEIFNKCEALREWKAIYEDSAGNSDYPYVALVLANPDNEKNIELFKEVINIEADEKKDKIISLKDILSDKEILSALCGQNGVLKREIMCYHHMMMSSPGVVVNSQQDLDEKWYYSKQIARRNLRIKHLIEKSYDFYLEIQKTIEEHNNKAEEILKKNEENEIGKQRIVNLVRLIARDNLYYDEEDFCWIKSIKGVRESVVVDMSENQAFEKEHRLFFIYKWIISIDDEEMKEMVEISLPKRAQIDEMSDEEQAEEKELKKKEKEAKEKMLEEFKLLFTNRENDRWKFPLLSRNFVKRASENGIDADEMTKFYEVFKENLA